MQVSRFFNFTVLLLVGSTALVTGCLPTPKDNKLTEKISSTFRVTSLVGESQNTTQATAWSIPQSRDYQFKACLEDLARKNSIVLSSFEVEMKDNSWLPVVSDNQGCITWTENVEFDFLSQPTFVKMNRQIRAGSKNTHRGTVSLQMALNPWSKDVGTEPSFLDLREGKSTSFPLSPDLSALRSRPLTAKTQLVVIKPSLMVNDAPNGQGTRFQYQLKFVPQLRLKDMLGNEFLYDLKNAQLEVTPYFIQKQINNRKILLNPSLQSKSVKMTLNEILFSSEVEINSENHNGTLLFGLKIVPVNAPAGIGAFEGLYQDGSESKALKGEHSSLSLSPASLADGFILKNEFETPAITTNIKDTKSSETTSPQKSSGFIADAMRGEFYGALENETNTRRTLPIEMSICLKDSNSKTLLIDEEFSVEVVASPKNSAKNIEPTLTISGLQFPKNTRQSGCLIFDTKLTHEVYQTEHFSEFTLRIKRLSTGQTLDRRIFLNPWTTAGNLLRDEIHYSKAPTIGTTGNGTLSAQPSLVFRSLNASLIEIYYSIDDQLRLQVNRRYNFQISPEVSRHDSSTQARETYKPLRTGYYLLTIALVRNSFEDAVHGGEYINSWQKVVLNEAGTITTEVDLSMRELALQGSQNRLLFELLPVNEEKLKFDASKKLLTPLNKVELLENTGLREKIFMSPFVLLDQKVGERVPSEFNTDTQNITISGRLTDWIRAQDETSKKSDTASTISTSDYAKKMNLQLIDSRNPSELADLNLQKITESERAALYECSGIAPIAECLKTKGFDPVDINVKLCRVMVNQIEVINTQRINQRKMPISPLGFAGQCYRNPFQTVRVDSKIHSYKLESQRFLNGLTRTFNVGVGTSLSEGVTHSVSHTKSLAHGFSVMEVLGFGLKEFGGVAGHAVFEVAKHTIDGAEVSASETESRSRGRSISISANTSAALVIQEAQFELNLGESQKCLAIYISDEIESLGNYSLIFENLHGYYVCDPTSAKPVRTKEKYYFVNQDFAQGNLLQNNDLRNRPWMLFIRGERDFNVFYSLIQQTLRQRDASGQIESPDVIFGESFDQIKGLLPAFNGVLTPSRMGVHSQSQEDQNKFIKKTSDFLPKPKSIQK